MNAKPNNKFSLRADGNKFILLQNDVQRAEAGKICAIKADTENPYRFITQESSYAKFDEFFAIFRHELSAMNTTQKNTDKIYSLCENLVNNTFALCQDNNGYSCCEGKKESVSNVSKYIIGKLREQNSSSKRKKIAQSNPLYVSPIEVPIGLKWITKSDVGNEIPNYEIKQTTFQFVSIRRTIEARFHDDKFKEMYFNYNENVKHECHESIFHDFCCGSIYKNHDIFDSKDAVQIRLAIDEFEPCDALKSKTGIHKMCGVYFQIMNVPERYRSRLDNIYLVALVVVEDTKHKLCSYDDVFKCIVDDLRVLETVGAQISPDITLKVALINISFDNLGGNSVYGIMECFVRDFYCRMCECDLSECAKGVREKSEKMRKMSDYLKHIEHIKQNEKFSLDDTVGIKKYCVFNDLKYFHIFENFSVDIMHDINEGVIPFFLDHFFNYLISSKILRLCKIRALIRDFDYGFLNRKYKPSKIRLTAHNLRQSARQIYCIMIHTPFIFREYQSKISADYWRAMENLLQIMQILYSSCIRDADIYRLERQIETYLKFVVDILNRNLTPKHHNLTHYPTIIRRIGPVIHFWMMRAEAKHKVFTDMIGRTNNYKNLPMTLANQHQEMLCNRIDSYSNKMELSKTKCIIKNGDFDKYKFCLPQNKDLFTFKFLNYNSREYRPGLMIVINREMIYEIIHILQIENEIVLLCHPYINVGFASKFNAIEIKKDLSYQNARMIPICDIQNLKTYDKIVVHDKRFITADTLSVYNNF